MGTGADDDLFSSSSARDDGGMPRGASLPPLAVRMRPASLEEVRGQALEMVAAAKRSLASPVFDPEQRSLLEMVADGVVERYA